MSHKVDALMFFLACECSDSPEGATALLSHDKFSEACKGDGYNSTAELKQAIYSTYSEFGLEHAKGVFELVMGI